MDNHNPEAVRAAEQELEKKQLASLEVIREHFLDKEPIREVSLLNLNECLATLRPGTKEYIRNHLFHIRLMIANHRSPELIQAAFDRWTNYKPGTAFEDDLIINEQGHTPETDIRAWVYQEYQNARKFATKHTALATASQVVIETILASCPDIDTWFKENDLSTAK